MTSNERRPRDEARVAIREFLSTRRGRITPQEAGLPTHGQGRRRVQGLRREEAALLVGVSPQYYIRLERGDALGVSDSVIDGLADALRLDAAERSHLMDLLRAAGASQRQIRRRVPTGVQVRPTITRLIDAMPGVPALVMNGRLDLIAANALGRALMRPLHRTDGGANNARGVFLDPMATTFFREWDIVADDTVALLRAEAGRVPHDKALSDLVGELGSRSDEFRVRWAAHDVRAHNTGIKKLRHPDVGDLDLPFESLPIEPGSSTNLVTYLPESGSATEDAVILLATWDREYSAEHRSDSA